MRTASFFDFLPVEIMHLIFSYFQSHEILLSFSNTSNHVDSVLRSYASYKINFKSISKSHFDLVCRRIQPSQIITLILSDADDTPGQSALFLTHFRLEQFSQLQSLRLINIEFDSLTSILLNLHHLQRLHSFTYDSKTIKIHSPNQIHNYSDWINQLNSSLSKAIVRLMPQLNRLSLSNFTILPTMSLTRLRHLKMGITTIDEFRTILSEIPYLHSLSISLHDEASHSEHLLLSSHMKLKHLTLKIENSQVSMDQVEQLLLKLIHLTHLELYATGHNDLANGNRWQIVSNSLTVLNFKFKILETLTKEILKSFCTSFWLVEKRWYVAYEEDYLFTVPHFAPVDVNFFQLQQHVPWTTFDKRMLYKQATKISAMLSSDDILGSLLDSLFRRFYDPNILLRIIATKIDMCQIQQMTLLSLTDIEYLKLYFPRMSDLQKLSIAEEINIDLVEQMRDYRMKQIRTLECCLSTENTSYIIEILLRLFPHVKHLYVSSISSKMDMIRLIDGFHDLSNASFKTHSKFGNIEQRWYFEPELLMYGSRRLAKSTYTCRLNSLLDEQSSITIQIWIEAQVSLSSAY
ncbi:unnamed protein product [Rotaria sp. Silwood2]|nr:unnamed protein product [Rotaria sp. Silwood2]